MRAGRLKRRIAIDAPVATQLPTGEEVNSWTQVAEVWARIVPLTGREKRTANQIAESGDANIYVRWSQEIENLTRECRLRDLGNGNVYEVKDKNQINFARREIEFLATVGMNDG